VETPQEQVAEVAGNLAVNGSFERREAGQPPNHIETLKPGSQDLAGWEIIDPLGKPGSAAVPFGQETEDLRTEGWTIDWIGPTRWQASHGRQSLDLDGGVRQTLATVPGRTYVLYFDAAANPEQGPNVADLRVLIDDESHDFKLDSTGKSAGDLGWARQRIQFAAQRKGTTLTFFNTSPTSKSAGVALDNVVVLDEDQVAKRGQTRGERYRVTESSQGPILLDSQTGQTWRLTTQEGQPVWLPIPRADKLAPDAMNPRRDE
jgi:choice-of-anchor C domain-containing protein